MGPSKGRGRFCSECVGSAKVEVDERKKVRVTCDCELKPDISLWKRIVKLQK